MEFRSRRILARILDMLAFAGFSALADVNGGGPLAALLGAWAAAYLLGADAIGVGAKNLLGLEVVDEKTGLRCSWFQSTMRNLSWWVFPFLKDVLPEVLHAQGPGRVFIRGIIAIVSLGVIVSLWRQLGDGAGRTWADRLAGTHVRKKSAAAAGNPVRRPGEPPADRPPVDPLALDFDDANDRDVVDDADPRPQVRRTP